MTEGSRDFFYQVQERAKILDSKTGTAVTDDGYISVCHVLSDTLEVTWTNPVFRDKWLYSTLRGRDNHSIYLTNRLEAWYMNDYNEWERNNKMFFEELPEICQHMGGFRAIKIFFEPHQVASDPKKAA